MTEAFESPEAAALAGWTPAARARVISVALRGDDAEVLVHVGPGYPDFVWCTRTPTGWIAGASGNGHVAG